MPLAETILPMCVESGMARYGGEAEGSSDLHPMLRCDDGVASVASVVREMIRSLLGNRIIAPQSMRKRP